MSAQFYSPWQMYDADGVEHPAFLRVQLSAVSQDELTRLLDEFRRQRTASAVRDDTVIAWLGERGIVAEIVPITPGMF